MVLRKGLLVILDEGEVLVASARCSVENKLRFGLGNKILMEIEQGCLTRPP